MTIPTPIVFDDKPSEDVAAAMEANMVAYMSYLAARLPGATVFEGPDLTLVDSGIPSDTFNVVCGARLDPSMADARVAAAIAQFQTRGIPFSWWVGPVSTPLDLGERLIAHGLAYAETSVGMALDLARLSVTANPPENLIVRLVTSHDELAAFARIVAANWDPPDQGVVDFYERAAAYALAPNSPLRLYIGYVAGEPVAASESFVGHGVVGIYSVCTLHHTRRRGFGTALTLTPLLDARAAGYRTATLQASPDGQRIYARLGFLPCGTFREYKPTAIHCARA